MPFPQPKLTRRQKAQLRAARPPRILIDDFEKLLEDFPLHIHAARKLKITDPKHDALIRTALRGFSLTSKPFKWHAPHYLYIQQKARLHYESMGDAPLLFFCLASGYALGLAEEDQLLKPEFKAAESHLDTLIRLNLIKLKDSLAQAAALAS